MKLFQNQLMIHNKNILKGKNCFITGATGGLGKSLASELALTECNLFLTSTNKKKLEELKKNLSILNSNITIYCNICDLRNPNDIKKIIKKFRNTMRTCDILINCAGTLSVKLLSKSLVDDFDSCFDINIRAPFLFSKEFSNDMKKKKWGRIVNIGSSSSYEGFSETSIYSASKHAILGFSRSIQKELITYGIRTYCFSPGSIKTKMGKQIKGQNYSTFINPTEIAEIILTSIQFDKEMITPEIRLDRIDRI
jgi:3-oxoacyl-[acyl-carrier protein] reductase|tara:strand:+ start:475 stop:1230 length:756 start_codon:yes stop_codon:yes gene_type:complete